MQTFTKLLLKFRVGNCDKKTSVNPPPACQALYKAILPGKMYSWPSCQAMPGNMYSMPSNMYSMPGKMYILYALEYNLKASLSKLLYIAYNILWGRLGRFGGMCYVRVGGNP